MAAEKLPPLGKWSDKSQAASALHNVTRDTEYKLLSDPDEVVPGDQKVKAYQVCTHPTGVHPSSYSFQLTALGSRFTQYLQNVNVTAYQVCFTLHPARHLSHVLLACW